MAASAIVEGQGLHGGVWSRLRLLRDPGPVRIRSGAVEARLDELVFDGASRSTRAATRDGRLALGTVEHLFAAFGGASVHEGVAIEIDGPEIPLADGGARVFVDALVGLEVSSTPSPLRVARRGVIDVGASRYELTPGEAVHVEVEIDFDDDRIERKASWDGDLDDFRDRIARARTFGFAHEVEALASRGLASHVSPESVVVIGDRILSAGLPFEADEPARHKLLDLVGDLFAHGGPPRGSVRAFRPGHAATHEAMRRAIADGLLTSGGER